MFIVYYKLGKERVVKHFNVKHQAIDFAEMQDNDDGSVKIYHMDPTNPQPTTISFDTMLNKAGVTAEPRILSGHPMDRLNKLGKVKDLLENEVNTRYDLASMPSFDRNEVELIIEEAMGKFFSIAHGLVEQIKRLTGGYKK